MIAETETTKLTEGLYWVGDPNPESKLHCNPYLLVHGGSVLLFDPGSVLDAGLVIEQVRSITPIETIDAIVLSHQDPDLCAGLPLFEQEGFQGELCCHERSATIIAYYGVTSPFYYVNREKYRYQLQDGSYIQFLPAPYLHFPGAIMSYLPDQKTLISGDLFGAFSDNWQLYAGEDYAESMKTYHESYMPSRDILRSVISSLEAYDIEMICPQHGSVITSNIPFYIKVLQDLECGSFLNLVHKDLMQQGGYRSLCNQLLARYFSIFGTRAVKKAFSGSRFVLDYQNKRLISSPYEGSQLWNEFFDQIFLKQGMEWLTIVSPLVEQMSRSYNIPLPTAFETLIFDVQKQQESFDAEKQRFQQEKQQLQNHLSAIEENLTRCPITGLYNQRFFNAFITEELSGFIEHKTSFTVFLLSIDNLADININFGTDEGNASLKNLAYILTREVSGTRQVFRLEGGVFALYLPNISKDAAVIRANSIKNQVADSRMFISPVSISIGLFHSDDLSAASLTQVLDVRQEVMQTARFRLKVARKKGGNSIVHESDEQNSVNAVFLILLVDKPGLARDLIKQALEQRRYRVMTADNGVEAKKQILEEHPDIIITELMLKKKGALTLRKELIDSSNHRHIPFILMTHTKDEQIVSRALNLDIIHILPRPVLLIELLGIVENISSTLMQEA
jgi:diguanylate cyclase (GGDEF)-like protein